LVNRTSFEQQTPITIHNHEFKVKLQPNALYSFTTTRGQQKALATPAENSRFPFPYKADFENEVMMATPKYFSDQGGAFEVARRHDQKGNCLRQVITSEVIEWEYPNINQTIVGDTLWTDYAVTCEIFFPEPSSYATISCRVMETHNASKLPDAYNLKLQSSGEWELLAGINKLASGLIPLKLNDWQTMKIDAGGDQIKAIINNEVVATLIDSTYTHGMAGLGSSFNNVDFDNFELESN
jgi:hypothetical protein